jgi:hypothetical protein
VAGQYLFRAELEAREERGTLRLTLRRWSEQRFDLTARDLAGRSLWRLEVDGEIGRLEGSGRERRCRFDPRIPLALPRLELPLAADSLPDLLLGRLPGADLVPDPEADERGRDADGRLWWIERRDSAIVGWRLVLSPQSADLTWRREDDGFRLESSDGALIVTWRESARATLALPPPGLERDPRLPECRELDVSS